jgi:tetratricopeptide (TPR) repeat protein
VIHLFNFKKLGVWFVGSLLLSGFVFASSEQLATLKKLLDSGQDKQAFEYAQKVYPENVGDADYDFMYSTAASRVGQYGRALFSLERLIAADPRNLRLQLELARLHFMQKNYEQSKVYFNQVMAKNPPKNVSDNIKRYLAEMDQKEKEANRINRYFVRFATGYDTNINSASADNFINVPSLGQIQLNTDAVQEEDMFFESTAGLSGSKSFIKNQTLFWAADVSHRSNPQHSQFNSDVADFAAGYAWQLGSYNLTLPVRYQQRNLETHSYQRSSAAGVELSRLFGEYQKGLVYFERAATVYPTQTILNKGSYLTALSWVQVLPQLGLMLQPTVLYLSSNASDSDAKYNGSKLYGAILKADKQLTLNNMLELSTGYQKAWYDRNNPLFDRRRRDEIYNSTAKWKWQVKRDLALDLSYTYFVDNSNLNLYRYDRQVTELGIEYSF